MLKYAFNVLTNVYIHEYRLRLLHELIPRQRNAKMGFMWEQIYFTLKLVLKHSIKATFQEACAQLTDL